MTPHTEYMQHHEKKTRTFAIQNKEIYKHNKIFI